MTSEERIEQALADEFGNPIDRLQLTPAEYRRIVRVAAEAVRAERERCAKVAEEPR